MPPREPPDHVANEAAARAAARRSGTRAPSAPPSASCGAVKPNGDLCVREAGWGTEHRGVGPCKTHDKGWAAMRADTKVEKYARPLLAKLTGYDVDVNPMDALLMCVRISAAEVAYFSERIGQLSEDDLMVRPTMTRTTAKQKGGDTEKSVVRIEEHEELNLWVKARKASLRDLAHFSKMAIDAGVDERMVRVHESVGESLAQALRGILDELGLSREQLDRAPDIVRRNLRLLQAGSKP